MARNSSNGTAKGHASLNGSNSTNGSTAVLNGSPSGTTVTAEPTNRLATRGIIPAPKSPKTPRKPKPTTTAPTPVTPATATPGVDTAPPAYTPADWRADVRSLSRSRSGVKRAEYKELGIPATAAAFSRCATIAAADPTTTRSYQINVGVGESAHARTVYADLIGQPRPDRRATKAARFAAYRS